MRRREETGTSASPVTWPRPSAFSGQEPARTPLSEPVFSATAYGASNERFFECLLDCIPLPDSLEDEVVLVNCLQAAWTCSRDSIRSATTDKEVPFRWIGLRGYNWRPV